MALRSPNIMRAIFSKLALLLVLCQPALATPQDIMANAVKSYMAGHVLDAEKSIQSGLSGADSPADQWSMMDLLTDLCTYAYDYQCVDSSIKPMQEIADKLKKPEVTAAKIAYVAFFDLYLTNNTQYFSENNALDFSLKIANPLANPVLAARLFLLNAVIMQNTGDFGAAHRYLDRAFASILQVDPHAHGFEAATLLTNLIAVAAQNHDAARAFRWTIAAAPLIETYLPKTSYDYANYLTVQVELLELLNGPPEITIPAMEKATEATKSLQMSETFKSASLSGLAVNEAAYLSLRGDRTQMRKAFESSPLFAKRDEIIKRGAFSSPIELLYGTADIFLDVLDGKAADQRWLPLLQKLPNWVQGSDARTQSQIFDKMALAFLEAKTNRQAALQLLREATQEDLSQFEQGKADLRAFPLPSLLDRVLLSISMGTIAAQPEAADADLLLGEMELINRNQRYVVSDTLAALAAQQTVEQRHATHALLRLADHQRDWEIDQLHALTDRSRTAHPAGQPIDFSPQFAAVNFATSQDQLRSKIISPSTALPKLAELQSALGPDEAFLGFAQGLRVCVRKSSVLTAKIVADQKQMGLDVKLLTAALSSQNSPSDTLDAQYPVAASVRLYHTLFDGLDDCLRGVRHLVFFPTNDVAAIPLAALLTVEPAKTGDGYDLGSAHWLLFDFAVSTVTSIRDFLSSRKLSLDLAQREDTLNFAGIGDPVLGDADKFRNLPPLPETRTEVETISKLFHGGTDIRLGRDATEEEFRSLPLDQYEVLHFATHGLLRDDGSGTFEAALVFTPGDSNNPFDDGLLTTSDVANLNLSARLVVLSACNTANFDVSDFASQLQGLASAFAAAGAPTTVASLWAVNSQVGLKLMTRFYQLMLGDNHLTVAKALQEAMIETLRERPSSAFANPRFWAPFVVLGDGGARISNQSKLPTAKTLVQVSPTGGEIVGLVAAPQKGTYITSAIGPSLNGRHVSLVQRAPQQNWVVQDPDIAAGTLVKLNGITFAAGSTWNGKSTPVLRAISDVGTVVWQKLLTSRFDSATISAMTADSQGIYVVISPFINPDKIDFDVVHFAVSGKELGRKSVSAELSNAQSVPEISYSAEMTGGTLFVAANYGATSVSYVRNDFGYLSTCNSGSGTSVFRLDKNTLSRERDANFPDMRMYQLKSMGADMIFVGAEQEKCVLYGERAVIGRLSPDLKSTVLWKDSGPFYSHFVGVVQHDRMIVGVEDISEPIDIPSYSSEILQSAVSNPKYISKSDTSLSEAVIVSFGPNGDLRGKQFLGNGLPQFADGITSVDNAIMIFGSDGFNPWINTLQ